MMRYGLPKDMGRRGRPPKLSETETARQRAQRAYLQVRRVDRGNAAHYDALYATTLAQAAAVDGDTATVMFTRTALLLELHIDRCGWPGNIFL